MAKNRKSKKRKSTLHFSESRQRKEFMQRIMRIARAAGAEDALPLISKKDFDWMFSVRFRSVRIEAADNNIPSRLLRHVKGLFDLLLENCEVPMRDDRPAVSLRDYLLVGMSLYTYMKGSKEQAAACDPMVREKFALFIKVLESDEDYPTTLIEATAGQVGSHISRVNRCLYWFNQEVVNTGSQIYICLNMHSLPPEKEKITINDISRLVYRVGWAFPDLGMLWAEVKGTDFGFDNARSHLPVQIFIQSHALIRLKERLDYVDDVPSLHLYLYKSLESMKVVKTESGKMLIEYRYNKKKLGYLAFNFLGKKLVIKTFLFLTMDGTPEGEALQQRLGIEATDKKYLEIDRLSTFILTDIKDNPEVLDKFIQAGCEVLFMLDNEEINAIPRTKKAHQIRSYLEIPAEELQSV